MIQILTTEEKQQLLEKGMKMLNERNRKSWVYYRLAKEYGISKNYCANLIREHKSKLNNPQ
ncbi:MAG: hypothetical protein LBN95_01670 [Prevotellaceae bacterium]|jgi:hypothetical protein|nr:hypothetical protein [Prevotellaceae bacterium]